MKLVNPDTTLSFFPDGKCSIIYASGDFQPPGFSIHSA